MKIIRNILWLAAFVLTSCAIDDDVPYPIVYGQITEFEVEGQCGEDGGATFSTVIDKDAREITLYVCDTVNLAALRVTKLTLSGTTYNPDVEYDDAPTVKPDPVACDNPEKFPTGSFREPTKGQNTVVDFRKPVKFTVHTYQDYEWTVTVKQVCQHEIELENQVGKAVIDDFQRNIIVYVGRNQDLRRIKVHKFQIGGPHSVISPNPLKTETYDFFDVCRFIVQTGWGEIQAWTMVVYQTDAAVEPTASAFPRNTNITISGDKPNGVTPEVMYRRANENSWTTAPQSAMQLTSTTYAVTISGLLPATKYIYKVKVGDTELDEQETTTLANQQLPNASFDEWSNDASNAKLLFPWGQGSTSFWDTGNRGATTVGNSNSIPTDDTSTGKGKAAYLESKYIVIKFAAGNIFTGTYLKTDGTNGILGFGRPFTGFPTRMTFDYKYKTAEITRIGDDNYAYLKGRPDTCQVYIALWHVEDDDLEEYNGEKYPKIIRTKPGAEQSLFSFNDPRIIAYAQMSKGQDVTSWTTETLTLNYKNTTLAPTHILVVASSSKYGDFFVGGVGSTLSIDNIQLHYD